MLFAGDRWCLLIAIAVRWLPIVVRCVLLVVCCFVLAVRCVLFVVCCLMFVRRCALFVVCCVVPDVSSSLFADKLLLFVGCGMWFVFLCVNC